MSARAGASHSSATRGWTWPMRPARRRRPARDGIRERRSPDPATGAGSGDTVVLSLIGAGASAAALGGPLQTVEGGLRGAVHGATEVLLDGELDLVPRGVVGRRELRVGQRVEVDLQRLLVGEVRDARLRDREEALGLDEGVDLVGGVVEVVEGLDRLLVARLLERHEVVGDTEGLALGAVVGRERRDAVVDLLVLVEGGGERAEADDHAGLAGLEQVEGVGAVGAGGVA